MARQEFLTQHAMLPYAPLVGVISHVLTYDEFEVLLVLARFAERSCHHRFKHPVLVQVIFVQSRVEGSDALFWQTAGRLVVH